MKLSLEIVAWKGHVLARFYPTQKNKKPFRTEGFLLGELSKKINGR
jgi:hypothetical protein